MGMCCAFNKLESQRIFKNGSYRQGILERQIYPTVEMSKTMKAAFKIAKDFDIFRAVLKRFGQDTIDIFEEQGLDMSFLKREQHLKDTPYSGVEKGTVMFTFHGSIIYM